MKFEYEVTGFGAVLRCRLTRFYDLGRVLLGRIEQIHHAQGAKPSRIYGCIRRG